MSTELSKNDRAIITPEQERLIQATWFPQAQNRIELELFLHVCRHRNLDPITRQIYPVKRWDATQKKEITTYQTSIDAQRLIAQRTGTYQGQDGPYWCGADGQWREVWLDRGHAPHAARVGVYRQGFQKPLYATAHFWEFCQVTKEGEATAMWRKMPANQLAKCAEALALRKAFPEELSGLYTADEMGQADNPPNVTIPSPAPQPAPPEPSTDQPVPEEVEHMWDKLKNIKAVCEEFARLKARLIELGGTPGEAEYYRILKVYGKVEHANQLKQKAARVASWEMWKVIQQAEMLTGDEPLPEQAK
jgi:phage recombination protein Bet